jgi:hypothetical protein
MFDEERSSHPQRYVERSNETQIEPVRSFESDPFTQSATDCVGRDKDPLRARGIRDAEALQLIDEGIHFYLMSQLATAPVSMVPSSRLISLDLVAR